MTNGVEGFRITKSDRGSRELKTGGECRLGDKERSNN